MKTIVLQARISEMTVDDLSDYLSSELDTPLQFCEVLEGRVMTALYDICT